MDGVLTDFQRGACELFNIPNPYLNPDNLGKYEITELINIPKSKFYDAMGRAFWTGLHWTTYGKAILTEILRHVDESQVTLLTSPIFTDGCMEGKLDWIQREMPRWSRRWFMGGAKWTIAAPGKLLIDDYDFNVNNWITHPISKTPTGGHAIMVPLTSNKLHKLDPIEWVRVRLAEYFNANATKLGQRDRESVSGED